MEGYNGSVFAYGQTGTGKTYTIGTEAAAAVTGHVAVRDDTKDGVDESMTDHDNDDNVGIIPRVIKEVFSTDKTITVKVILFAFSLKGPS